MVKHKQIEENKFNTGETIDTFGREVDIEAGKAQEFETQSTQPLVDEGTGQKILLRCFEFKLPPKTNKDTINKQELFNTQWQMIQTYLWKDGLIHIDYIDPRITYTKDGYKIFITCVPRAGQSILERAQTLQQITHG